MTSSHDPSKNGPSPSGEGPLPSPSDARWHEGEATMALGDLVDLLGYLQGDVAQAIREPLEELRRHAPGPRTRRLVEEALAAVSILEGEESNSA